MPTLPEAQAAWGVVKTYLDSQGTPVPTPPIVTPPSGVVISPPAPNVVAPDGATFIIDGSAVNRNGVRVGVPGRYADAIARDSAGAIKARVQTTGANREWLLYPNWTATSAPV